MNQFGNLPLFIPDIDPREGQMERDLQTQAGQAANAVTAGNVGAGLPPPRQNIQPPRDLNEDPPQMVGNLLEPTPVNRPLAQHAQASMFLGQGVVRPIGTTAANPQTIGGSAVVRPVRASAQLLHSSLRYS